MTEEVRALAQAKQAQQQGLPVDMLLKELRIWGERQAPFRKAVTRINAEQTRKALSEAASIDRLIKGIGSGDVWESFLRLGLLLAKPAVQALSH